jgi:tetratricopeptide (TPR) repeat protein
MLRGAAFALVITTAATAQTPQPDKAAAYYHYSVGHMYAELAGQYGNRGDLFTKAVDNFKAALKEDPTATFINEELTEMYVQSGKLREAVTEAEEALKQNPNDLNARRMLARIYTKMIGGAQNKVDETMVRKAIEQYQTIVAKDPKDVDSWVTLGQLQKVSQNSVEAQNAYKKALEVDPNNDDALTGLAMVYADLGDNKQATELLRKAAEKNPNAKSFFALGKTYEQMKEFGLAAEAMKKASEQAPGNPEILRAMAEDLLFSDQYDEALKVYQDLVTEDPKDVQSQLRISQVYRQKRDFANARAALDKAKQIDPSNLEVQFYDANLLEAEGKTPEAIAGLKEVLNATARKSYDPAQRGNRVMLLERLGYLYSKNEQYPQAAETYRQIGEVDPDSAAKASAFVIDAYRSARDFPKADQEAAAAAKKYPGDRAVVGARASLLADEGKSDQAVAETKKLLDGKNDRETYLSLAQIYEKAKNWPEMGKALDSAEKVSNGKEELETIHFMRGAMFERMKNFDSAEAEFKKVLAVNPDSGAALNYLGYMLADRNVRLDEAHKMVSRAVELEPNSGAYLDSLGWVYFRQNKLAEAEKQLLRSVELMGKDPTVHDHLGDVYFQEGKVREAVAQWQNSLKAYKAGPPSEMDENDVAKVQKKLDSAKVRLAKEGK